MKRTNFPYLPVLLMLALFGPGLRSQGPYSGATGERLRVCTDRTMYVSGENMFFSVLLFNNNNVPGGEFSRICYAELITPDGRKISAGKYLLYHNSGQGSLAIPEESISGVYFLKFYTRFMRNAGTGSYTFIRLKIINPYRTEVLASKGSADTADHAEANPASVSGDSSWRILSSANIYGPRDEIRLNIRGKAKTGERSNLCLSVIPEFTMDYLSAPVSPIQEITRSGFYVPETRGVSLSGQVTGKENSKPVPGARVNLSIIGDKDFRVVRTDSLGRFFFVLPDYSGKKDIFICADEMTDTKPEIFIDNDFCTRPLSLPSQLFSLSEEEAGAAYALAVNSRVASLFNADTVAADPSNAINPVSFYGKPTEILFLDKYIELPTLGEYFTQLPGMVRLKKIQGKNKFRFYDAPAETEKSDPLLLVDWVAVNDIEKVLAMSPPEIERIELVNAPYVKGNVTYGGIICFVSKKNNFAGIDLPKSGTFLNYMFPERFTEKVQEGPLPANIPDARNTLYWDPAVALNEDGTTLISFTAPDTPGKYVILLREMDPSGVMVLSKALIVVKR